MAMVLVMRSELAIFCVPMSKTKENVNWTSWMARATARHAGTDAVDTVE